MERKTTLKRLGQAISVSVRVAPTIAGRPAMHVCDGEKSKPPKSATLTHLDEWLSRLTRLQSLGNTSTWISGIRSNKIIQLAEEAQSLPATDVADSLPPKRFALLVCLIHQAQISTRDQIIEMFIKRMSKLTAKAKEELERLREEDSTTTERLNAFEDWITFAGAGTISERAYIEQEKRIKYTGLIANCVMLDKTLEISDALNVLVKEGLIPTVDELAALSPYQTKHIRRFGNYELDLSAVPVPIADDLTFAIEPLKDQTWWKPTRKHFHKQPTCILRPSSQLDGLLPLYNITNCFVIGFW